jgi:hypothetical protein
MIPFTGRTSLLQYVRGKPNPWGLKNFVLATPKGLVLDFEIYQGANTNIQKDKKLGLGGSVVMRLAETIPPKSKVFFDRYFTSEHLIRTLLEKNIYGTGTLMKTKTPCSVMSDKDLQKKGRGSWDELVSTDGNLACIKWMDNRSVIMLSSLAGSKPSDSIQRWCRKLKNYVSVSRPAVIKEYNESMGGVDVCDQLISLYRIDMKTRKWPVKVIFHFVNLTIVNSWLEYRKQKVEEGEKFMDLLDFSLHIAVSLLKGAKSVQEMQPIDQQSNNDNQRNGGKKSPKNASTSLPIDEIRFDRVDHFPESVKKLKSANRCRWEKCLGKSRVKCMKCNVFLCLKGGDENCFYLFHNK